MMFFKMLIIWLVFLSSHVVNGSVPCPVECECKDTKQVVCVNRNITVEKLITIAKNLPINTTVVTFEENVLTYFPTKEFQRFTQLNGLRLGNNLIDVYPQNLSTMLPSLETIYINKNKFVEVTRKNLKGYDKIKNLDLYGNRITQLPPELFSDCPNLQKIFLEKNLISNISKTAFSKLNNLEELTMSRNKLKSIPPGTFNDLTKLEKLYLNNNFLVKIPSDLFKPVPKLYYLYLQGNSIETIAPGAFNGEPDIDLSNNKIKKLYKSAFRDGKIYEILNLDNNPIDCDCNLYEVYHLLKSKKGRKIAITGRCQSPPSVFNETIISVVTANKFNCTVCTFNPCKNNGTCNIVSKVGIDDYTCTCSDDYEGKQCEDRKICASNPCLNNGVCNALNKTVYSCKCADGFRGDRCEKEIMCFQNPCLNNGSCNVVNETSFVCNCTKQFQGKTCKEEVPCWRNPCLNNGTCYSINATQFGCKCLSMYTGHICQHKNEIDGGENENKKFKVGWIVLIVLCVAACIAFVAVALIYRQRRRDSYKSTEDTPMRKTKTNPVTEKTPLQAEA